MQSLGRVTTQQYCGYQNITTGEFHSHLQQMPYAGFGHFLKPFLRLMLYEEGQNTRISGRLGAIPTRSRRTKKQNLTQHGGLVKKILRIWAGMDYMNSQKEKKFKKRPKKRPEEIEKETEETEFREAHNAVSLDSPLTSSPSWINPLSSIYWTLQQTYGVGMICPLYYITHVYL